jgi:hypothetical protein
MHEAFVYSWRNVVTGRLYVGWHKGSTEDGYVCSSKPMKEEYRKTPEIFERYIIAHGSADDMIALEQAILTAEDAKNNDLFYNQTNGNRDFVCKVCTEEHRAKISASNKGRKHSEEAREKMRAARILSNSTNGVKGMKGKKHSTLTTERMKRSQAALADAHSERTHQQWARGGFGPRKLKSDK